MNIASVSWADHLTFGEGDGRLDTPEKVSRRMRVWREELGAGAIHWRLLKVRIPGRFFAARGYRHPSLTAARNVTWDDLTLVPDLAHEAGLEAWLYVTLFDEGWPLASKRQRARSYHNAMHAQEVAWQSDLTRTHPDWVVVDRSGRFRQWGVVSCAYPDARRAFVERWTNFLTGTRFDGLFVCLRSQSRPPAHADQFGFNDPVRADFKARYGVELRTAALDMQAWRDLCGEYLTRLLVETREALARSGVRLGVGVARGDLLGPPLGNQTLPWRQWVERRLVDHLVVDQNSSQCPSMWHQLWPMHRGNGYLQNYLDGTGLPPLAEHLASVYGPAVIGSSTALYVARQWQPRCGEVEQQLGRVPGVTGLVFSTFRHDNPGAVARNQWTVDRSGHSERSNE
jgi:hypothetical protein